MTMHGYLERLDVQHQGFALSRKKIFQQAGCDLFANQVLTSEPDSSSGSSAWLYSSWISNRLRTLDAVLAEHHKALVHTQVLAVVDVQMFFNRHATPSRPL